MILDRDFKRIPRRIKCIEVKVPAIPRQGPNGGMRWFQMTGALLPLNRNRLVFLLVEVPEETKMAYKLNVLISVLKFNLLFGLTCDFYLLASFPKRGTEVNDGDAGIRCILSKIVSVSIPLVIFLGSPADQVHEPQVRWWGPWTDGVFGSPVSRDCVINYTLWRC